MTEQDTLELLSFYLEVSESVKHIYDFLWSMEHTKRKTTPKEKHWEKATKALDTLRSELEELMFLEVNPKDFQHLVQEETHLSYPDGATHIFFGLATSRPQLSIEAELKIAEKLQSEMKKQ